MEQKLSARMIMEDQHAAYQAALDYLYGFVDYSLTRNFRNAPENFDLARMLDFLELLGDPHHQFVVFHVAGTKGKGSTSALLASALQAGGYRVGLYTSPHLQEYTERIQVNSQQIAPGEFAALVNEIKPIVARVPRLTTFEITTALGFLYFARRHVTAAVIEVGLGGRLDATNVVDPLVSVITSLSMDHMAVLGDTLAKIAYEKAGILKPGRPAVFAPQPAEARAVIEQIAQERGCPVWEVGRDIQFQFGAHTLDGQSFTIWGDSQLPQTLTIPLLGSHQVENAATAYAALQAARAGGFLITDTAIETGFARVNWPARFEILRREPPIVIDSAHNRDSALRLRETLDTYYPGRPIVLLFGASEDKDIAGMLEALLPRVRCMVTTQSVHPRALAAQDIAALAAGYAISSTSVVPVEAALVTALKMAEEDQALVVAAGSVFLAAAVREVWLNMTQQRN